MSGIFRFLSITVLVLLVVLAALFVSFNDTELALWLLRDFSPRPLGQWMILAFVCGGFIGLVLGYGFWRRLRYRLRIRQLEQRVRELEQLQNRSFRDTV